MNRAPSVWQISTRPMSSSIGEGFWKPKKIAVRPVSRARRTSSPVRPWKISSGKRSNQRFHRSMFSTVSRKVS